MDRIRAVVSGSFHRHMTAITDAVAELCSAGVAVLSPSDPRVVDAIGAFLFVASDRHRSVRLVQDRHLACICHAHFLWLVCPDGYVGQSASMEVGFAVADGTPIFSSAPPSDLTLRQYVTVVEGVSEAIAMASRSDRRTSSSSLLIDPVEATEEVHREVETLRRLLCSKSLTDAAKASAAAHRRIRDLTSLPGNH